MRVIIELDPGTQVSTSASQSAISSANDAAAAVDVGPPRMAGGDATGASDSFSAQDLGGPPDDLIAETRPLDRMSGNETRQRAAPGRYTTPPPSGVPIFRARPWARR